MNIDGGTGRVRGASIFGPPEAGDDRSRESSKPFEELGVAARSATSSRATGGTDSTSFNEAGLPGIGAQQDPIEYNSHTWHTNLDTYERIIEDDVKRAAITGVGAVPPRDARRDAAALPGRRDAARRRRHGREDCRRD